MDSTPDRYNGPRIGLRRIPDDVIIYILDFLESTTLAVVTLANRHLQELVTPALYRNITIPKKYEKDYEHLKAVGRLLRTLSQRPSLTVLVRHLENAPPAIHPSLLETIWSEHTNLPDSQRGSVEQSAHADTDLQRVAIDVMKSCVNLRSLTLAGHLSPLYNNSSIQWLSFLLDSSINLKSFKTSVSSIAGSMTRTMWNGLVARILDVQLSLEYLDFSFDNKASLSEEERMERWAPKLRVLGGCRVRGLRALLSNKRPIETLVVRSIRMRDLSRLCAAQVKSMAMLKEIIYHGPAEDEHFDFLELFEAMPTSLEIFRGEMWMKFLPEDLFFQELLKAFALTPHLTKFDIRDSSYSLKAPFCVGQADIFHTGLASHEEDCLGDQATWLARYSEICSELRSFTFPNGKRWARTKDQWIFQDRFSRNNVL